MEITSSPIKSLAFGQDDREDSWPEVSGVGDCVPADTTDTDTVLCDRLQLLAQSL